jgi:NAD(P)-dependent dehydrogenase (short-subunit alcohol dehydrogenase family)
LKPAEKETGNEAMKWNEDQIPNLDGTTAIVTGANTGIGFETARALAAKGCQVVLACRSAGKGETAVARILEAYPEARVALSLLDLADLDSVRDFVERFRAQHTALHLLINNAGVMWLPRGTTKQGFELHLGINHLGHFALTGQLLPALLNTSRARVVTVSSLEHRPGVMRFDDLDFDARPYGGRTAYSQSKLANLLFTFELQRRLESMNADAISVAAHPGWTATDLQRNSRLVQLLNPVFAMDAPQGALPTLRAATDPEAKGGDYFGPNQFFEIRGYPERVGTTQRAKSLADAARLWEVSEERTGVHWQRARSAA